MAVREAVGVRCAEERQGRGRTANDEIDQEGLRLQVSDQDSRRVKR